MLVLIETPSDLAVCCTATNHTEGAHIDPCPPLKAPTMDASELDIGAMETMTWSDESLFFFFTSHDGQVCVSLTWGTPGTWTHYRAHASGVSVVV